MKAEYPNSVPVIVNVNFKINIKRGSRQQKWAVEGGFFIAFTGKITSSGTQLKSTFVPTQYAPQRETTIEYKIRYSRPCRILVLRIN